MSHLLHLIKTKQPSTSQLIDHNYMNSIYLKIVENMEVLDRLNDEYKMKQQEHFLKTFMSVLQKMGNDLILAQEAYRNVDLEARKDNYCLLLAKELSFFKEQSFNLRELLNSKEKQIHEMKTQMATMENELNFLKQGFQSKVKQCMKLKSEIQGLKRQIKYLSDPANNSIFRFTNPEAIKNIGIIQENKKKSMSLTNYLEQGSLQLKKIGNRLSMTNGKNRRKNNSMTLEIKGSTQRNHFEGQTNPESLTFRQNRKQQASTHSSFRKKLISQHLNRTALQLYQPLIES